MYEQDIPTRYHFGDQEIDLQHLHQTFSGSVYGPILAEAVRYGVFKPKSMDKSEWHHLLGADVNNLEHMRLTRGITRQFIRYCHAPPLLWARRLSPETIFDEREQEDLLLCATIHDWGEAEVKDININLKTDIDEKKEMKVLNRMIHETFGLEHHPELSARASTVVRNTLTDRTSKLGRAFNAIERAGYLRTGLIAMDRIDTPEGQPIADHLRALTNNVLLNQIPPLLRYAELYPPIDALLRLNGNRITHAFEITKAEDNLGFFNPERMDKFKTDFALAKSLWGTSSFAHPPESVQ